jgi:hypothetical protein
MAEMALAKAKRKRKSGLRHQQSGVNKQYNGNKAADMAASMAASARHQQRRAAGMKMSA